MAVVAPLFQNEARSNRRKRDRRDVRLGATIRDSDARPLDAVVHDLSATGFLVQSSDALRIGSVVRIGLSGIGSSAARVLWKRDGLCGCAFIEPISEADIETALHARTVTEVDFSAGSMPAAAPAPAPSRKIAMLAVLGLSVLLWAATAGGIVLFG